MQSARSASLDEGGRLMGAIEGAAWNAVRTLNILDELEGGVGKVAMSTPGALPREQSAPRHSTTSQGVGTSPPDADHIRHISPSRSNRSASGSLHIPLHRGIPTADPPLVRGDKVVLLDSRIVGSLCAETRCKVPDINQFCGGKMVGTLISRTGPLAIVDFQSVLLTLPFRSLVSALHMQEVQQKYSSSLPPKRDLKSQQLAQLVRSLRLKGDELRRKEDELINSKQENFLLKRQLDRAGMANWVHAPIVEGKVLFVPKGDVAVPVGTDIVHHTDSQKSGENASRSSSSSSSSSSEAGPSSNGEIILGSDGICSIVQEGGVIYAKNRKVDMQLDFCLKVGGSNLQPAPDRVLWSAKNPNTFTVRLFPHETVAVIESGDWDGTYAASFSHGPVNDRLYLGSLLKQRNFEIEREMSEMEAICNVGVVDVHSGSSAEDALDLCITQECKFVDYQFMPTKESIIHPDAPVGASETIPSTWDRLGRISPNGSIFTSQTLSSDSIIRGSLGDFGFMGAVAILADPIEKTNPESFLLKKLLAAPLSDNVLAKEMSCGAYRVSLCANGWWSWYLVDDYVPVFDVAGSSQIAFARNSDPSALWTSILQKAYAKVCGGYNAITQGNVGTMFEDLTGMPFEIFDWGDPAGVMENISQHLVDNDIVVLTSQSTDPLTAGDVASDFHGNGIAPGSLYRVISIERDPELETVVMLQIQSFSGKPTKWKGDHSGKETTAPNSFWATPEEISNFFGGAGALIMTTGWTDIRLKTGFHEAKPIHAFQLEVYKDTEAVVCVLQPDNGNLPTAGVRVEVVELRPRQRWDTVVESSERYCRCRSVHTPRFYFRAGCHYSIVIHQFATEQNRHCRNRKDIVLNLATEKSHFGWLTVSDMTREMSERLNYAGFPGFHPANGRPVSVRAQFNAVECQSSTIFAKDLTADHKRELQLRSEKFDVIHSQGSPQGFSDSDSETEDQPVYDAVPEQQYLPDPSETAARLRNHVGTVIGNLHPEDRELLCGIADSLDQGELAATDFVSGLFRKNRI
eukprot:TRINITY_DN15296_c0_g1_i2.p1 TRINITY_DN15296_c0_g1~~TRINITY_DN15296_c0_g1_i2.p1  ORF type:complete len:1028 (+),score=176.93 TRINITY_DN15296_c0_g1_i2:90-3173(+)